MSKKFSNLRKEAFKSIDNWDRIVERFKGSIYYSVWSLRYNEVYNKKSKIKNLSFGIYDEEKIVALVPLYIEEINGKVQMSMGENAIYSPLFEASLDSKEILGIYEFIIDNINNLSIKYRVNLARFQVCPLNLLIGKTYYINYYELCGFRPFVSKRDWYINKCNYTYILDLSLSIDELYLNIRKSYKSLINKTRREVDLVVLEKGKVGEEEFNKYKEAHYKVKGRNRSEEAFSLDLEGIREGKELVLIANRGEEYIGVVVVYIYNGYGIYNSALTNTEDKKIYPNHYLLWESIRYLKERNYRYFYLGEQVSRYLEPNEEEMNLSHFKAAWGGDLVPWLKVEYNFNF